jgi:cation transport protein ChaC
MARRPEGGDVWVFAYGSLMWNPISRYDARRVSTLHGWHRSFCLRITAARGSPENPGRMLSIEAGGSTQGVAIRLCQSTLEEELRILWTREMVTGAYLPTWAPITLDDGTRTSAIAFVADPAQSQYEADVSTATIAPLMAVASGSFGTNAEYVFKLQWALAECGMNDPYIDEIASEIRRLCGPIREDARQSS